MLKIIKKVILYSAKCSGILAFSRYLTRNKLRIICYHGFSFDDQASFRPKLYIKPNTFKSRIDSLLKNKYRFLDASGFYAYLKGQKSYYLPVLLTIDDGWKSTHEMALPVLREHRIPHFIYLYTDCYQKEIPVVNVLLQYAIWKTPLLQVTWSSQVFDLGQESDKEALLTILLDDAQSLDRTTLHEKLIEIFKALKVDYSLDREWKYFSLLNQSEIKDHLLHNGSIQLHTHHHINPLQDDMLTDELSENRRIIEMITGEPADHLCYPSGVYSRDQFPLLERQKIKSSVTCKPGLNDTNTHPYELNRFLDGDDISQIEFEAEMSGFMDIMRKLFT